MLYVRAAYFLEIEPYLSLEDYPIPDGYALRQTKHGPIEARKPLEIKVKWYGRKGNIKTGIWRAKPGRALIVRTRKIKENELDLLRPYGYKAGDLVAYMVRETDLFSAARKYLRHIIRSLVGKLGREKVPRGPGRHQQAQIWINLLCEALEESTNALTPNSPEAQKSNRLLLQVITVLSKTQQKTLQQAQKEIERARGDQRITNIAKAIGLLGLYREEKLKQIRGIAKIGLSIIQVINQINCGVHLIYYQSIPKLMKKLEPYAIQGIQPNPQELLAIARQIENLYQRIQRVFAFDPYYHRAQSPQVKRLAKACEYAQKGDALGLYNALTRAHAIIEALVLGEQPIPSEIQRTRRWLRRYE